MFEITRESINFPINQRIKLEPRTAQFVDIGKVILIDAPPLGAPP
jgi:hypothetical protein